MSLSLRWPRVLRRMSDEGVALTCERLAVTLAPRRRLLAAATIQVLCHPDAGELQSPPRRRTGYRHERVSIASLPRLAAVAAEAGSPATLLQRFASFLRAGGAGHALCHGDEIIACIWMFRAQYVISFDADYADSAILDLPHDAWCIGNGMIRAAHRAAGLFPLLIACAVRVEHATNRLYSSVLSVNRPSLGAHLRLGFEPAGCLRLLGVGSRRSLSWRAPGPDAWWQPLTGQARRIPPGTVWNQGVLKQPA